MLLLDVALQCLPYQELLPHIQHESQVETLPEGQRAADALDVEVNREDVRVVVGGHHGELHVLAHPHVERRQPQQQLHGVYLPLPRLLQDDARAFGIHLAHRLVPVRGEIRVKIAAQTLDGVDVDGERERELPDVAVGIGQLPAPHDVGDGHLRRHTGRIQRRHEDDDDDQDGRGNGRRRGVVQRHALDGAHHQQHLGADLPYQISHGHPEHAVYTRLGDEQE